MAQIEILEELKKLTTTERLAIIEATLRLIREDLQRAERPGARTGLKQRMTSAAEALLCRTMLQVAN